MLFARFPILVRGGGDLATGVIHCLHQAGFPVGVVELAHPLTVRRRVALSSAIYDGTATVEGLRAQRVNDAEGWQVTVEQGGVPVAVCDSIPDWIPTPAVVIDARLAKRNIDTCIDDADFVVALGPGFDAGIDCDVVVETNRGGRLGRIIEKGSAQANTGTPGVVSGYGSERVLRSPASGMIQWQAQIGDLVEQEAVLGTIAGMDIHAPFDGVIRGLLHPDCRAESGLKIGDIDPRLDAPCDEISDKALAMGGAVVVAVLGWMKSRAHL
jgi:xanthine dehydrogenase accessory factor